MKQLKLVRWFDDGFPPVDLNANVRDVVDLVREIKRLESLISKYASHVATHEGIDFLQPGYESDILTPEEMETLRQLT